MRVTGMKDGIQPLSHRLISELEAGKQVLWLVPGGSNIPLSVDVMNVIPDELTGRLIIMLTDERYGPVGHKDSNTVQLELAGFKPKASTILPVLHDGLSLTDTAARFAGDFEAQSQAADCIIGQFGMGADGHLAGMLPGSEAVTTDQLAFGYQTPTFTRITLTPPAIQRVEAAYVFAFGDEKHGALSNLENQQLSLSEQPAQILKQIPESYIYNDQIGGAI